MSQNYLILSAKHSPAGDLAVWWGPNRSGYTPLLARAGRYSYDEAIRICAPSHPRMPPASFPVSIAELPFGADGRPTERDIGWREAKARFTPVRPLYREATPAGWEAEDEDDPVALRQIIDDLERALLIASDRRVRVQVSIEGETDLGEGR